MQKIMTKALAENTAKAMCDASIGARIGILKDRIESMAYGLVKASIPSDVVTFHEEHPRVCRTSSYAYISTEGLNPVSVSLKLELPDKGKGFNILVEKEEYEGLLECLARERDLKQERNRLKANIEATLLSPPKLTPKN